VGKEKVMAVNTMLHFHQKEQDTCLPCSSGMKDMIDMGFWANSKIGIWHFLVVKHMLSVCVFDQSVERCKPAFLHYHFNAEVKNQKQLGPITSAFNMGSMCWCTAPTDHTSVCARTNGQHSNKPMVT
jgi:hypothetical protein